MADKIMGIDEAGRGCVLGPMVLAGVVVSPQGWERLQEIGVKDSKQLTPKRRGVLCPQIQTLASETEIISLLPQVIDSYCHRKLLNYLEIETMAALINKLQPDLVYIDALGTNCQKFAGQVSSCLTRKSIKIIAENHADANYPVVSAASILAKVTRDAAIEELRQQLGDFGSGYPSDPKTCRFLLQTFHDKGQFPAAVRQSWQTVRKIVQGTQSLWNL